MTEHPPTRYARLYLHLFVTAACVVPVASYILSTFGWRAGDIGVGTAVIGIAGTIASPLWGRLDDRTTWAPRAAVLGSAAAVVLAGPTCAPGGEVLVQLVQEELRAMSPFSTRLVASEASGSAVLQGGLDAGLNRLRARLFADGGRVDAPQTPRDAR